MSSTSLKSTQSIAWKNGELIAENELGLSYADQGVVHGVAVTEMLRTFHGTLFELEAHLDRLFQSAKDVRIPIHHSREQLRQVCEEIADHNYRLLPEGGELGLIVSATPGLNPTYTGKADDISPTIFIHTFPLPAHYWSLATQAGLHLAISNIIQVPERAIPVQAKTRSRMAWYLADQDVAERYPDSRAIVLDQFGFVRETTTANLFVVRDGTIMTAPEETVLPGISRAVTIQFIRQRGYPFRECEFTVDDLLQSQEIFTTSTPYALLGVSRLNSSQAGIEFPGKVTQQLLNDWNDYVGLDIHQQIRTLANRS